jgi:hypothetical protein
MSPLVLCAPRAHSPPLPSLREQLQAAAWVIAAALTGVYARVGPTLADPSRTLPPALYLAYASLGLTLTIGVYLALYLPYVARIDLPWSTYVPWAIPVATGSGVTAFLCLIVGLWPAFGLLTPLLVATLFMGAMMATHFLPPF